MQGEIPLGFNYPNNANYFSSDLTGYAPPLFGYEWFEVNDIKKTSEPLNFRPVAHSNSRVISVQNAPMQLQGLTLWWEEANNDEEGHYIYRSQTPMNPDALPDPIATIGYDMTYFIDATANEAGTYYYRVAAFKGDEIAVSDETEAIISS